MQNEIIPWSDNWWIEKDSAWFCAGKFSALFCVDMKSQQCELVARIPKDDFINFRLHPHCIKYKDTVFCLPNFAKDIWCYHLEKKLWKKIEIGNVGQIIINISTYIEGDVRIWMLEEKRGRIFAVNLDKEILETEYFIKDQEDTFFDGQYVLAQNGLYYINNGKIYSFNINNVDISLDKVYEIEAGLYTISYDGMNFWLSGCCNKIYIWNPKDGVINVAEFPPQQPHLFNQFPAFQKTMIIGKYLWCIPFEMNEIIYVSIDTYEIFSLEIKEEQQTWESIKNNFLHHKYIVEYIRENRYIGVYSLKNRWIFEIDTLELCVSYKDYLLSDVVMQGMGTLSFKENDVLSEESDFERKIFAMALRHNYEEKEKVFQNIGEKVFQSVNDGLY